MPNWPMGIAVWPDKYHKGEETAGYTIDIVTVIDFLSDEIIDALSSVIAFRSNTSAASLSDSAAAQTKALTAQTVQPAREQTQKP